MYNIYIYNIYIYIHEIHDGTSWSYDPSPLSIFFEKCLDSIVCEKKQTQLWPMRGKAAVTYTAVVPFDDAQATLEDRLPLGIYRIAKQKKGD